MYLNETKIMNTRLILTISTILVLAACGGSTSQRSGAMPTAAPMATGPINTACLQSNRKARSRALCGCIQAVANQSLSSSDQRRAVKFYQDPDLAQKIRQSDRPGDERFWRSYSAYAARAEQICQ